MRPNVPATARWLLDRFGLPQQNESLMGDLVEEYASGRSALWFWRQTVVVLAEMVARDLRNHKALAVRAIATGWLLYLAWERVMNLLGNHYMLWRSHSTLWVILLSFSFLCWPAIIGWAVARAHRAQQAAMVLAFTTSMAIWDTWYLAAHYSEMKGISANPDVWTMNVVITFIGLLATLLGGFVLRPRRHF